MTIVRRGVFHGLSLSIGATPGPAPLGRALLWAVDQNGRIVLEYTTPSGLVVRLGRDNLFVAKVKEAGGVVKGDVVYISSASGANEEVQKWVADGSISKDVVGLVVEPGNFNDFVFVQVLGKIGGLNTLGIAEGNQVFASPTTPGAFTGTEPAHPNLRAEIGFVTREHAVQGEIMILPLLVRGDHVGTRRNSWQVGNNLAGAKDLVFRNGFDLTLRANPTGARIVTLPDATATLAGMTITNTGDFRVSGNVVVGSGGSELWVGGGAARLRMVRGSAEIVRFLGESDDWAEVQLKRIQIDGGPVILSGTGSPEGVHARPVGSLFLRTDGGTNTTVYRKETGGATSTGWVAIGAGGGGGDNISVNGSAALDANFNATTPAAPAGGVNVKWQKDTTAPDNISAHLAANDVSNTVLADMAANTVKANPTAGSADPADLAVGTNSVVGRVAGNIVAAPLVTDQVTNAAITYAKLQNISATARLLGRITAGAGSAEELTGTQATTLLDLFTSTLKGLVPGSGGGTTNFLRADGTWALPPGGGGGSPGGVGTNVQFNNGAGGFGGAARVDVEQDVLGLIDGAEPSAPAAGALLLYGRLVANRMMVKQLGPSGVDTPLQPFLGTNAVAMWLPQTGTTMSQWGLTHGTVVGTATTPAPASTSMLASIRRFQLVSAATGNASATVFGNVLVFWRGNGAGLGGWMASFRFGIGSNVANQKAFVGLHGSNAAISTTAVPGNLTNLIGVGADSADANLQIIHNDGAGAATKVDLGASFPARTTNSVYELMLFAPPNGGVIGWRVTRQDVAAVASGTINTDLPATTQFLAPHFWLNNGGTAAASTLAVTRLYIETDL